MSIYIDRELVPDVNNIPETVLKYVIKKHKEQLARLQKLHDYYYGNHAILTKNSDDEDSVQVMANYAKYIVDVGLGYYLGEAIKYDAKKIASEDGEEIQNKKPEDKPSLFGTTVDASLDKGRVVKHDWKLGKDVVDITRLVDVYENQTISEVDNKIGKGIGIYGKAYELLYASTDEVPEPRSAGLDPRTVVVVRDTSVEHKKIFAIVYEEREDLSEQKYYFVTVYTETNYADYKSTDLENFQFNKIEGSEQEHFFGDIPIVEYQNNDERQGDFEQVTSLIDALNELYSDRVTDKKKFVNAILALFGATLDDDDEGTQMKRLKEERYIELPYNNVKMEYIQKVFDENSIEVLSQAIIREIHKQTLTVDMTDEKFAGNSSGQAMKLKLLTMNMLVKNKMRQLEKGLKKRMELYNNWLSLKGEMDEINRTDVDVVFTISMPINEQEVVNMVKQLQGIVDDKTLLAQLWFIKDPEDAFERIKAQKQEAQKAYMDSFNDDDPVVEDDPDDKKKDPAKKVEEIEEE